MELERQMEKQRQIEREKEQQRQKMLEQKEVGVINFPDINLTSDFSDY